jgi:hypothetical protein
MGSPLLIFRFIDIPVRDGRWRDAMIGCADVGVMKPAHPFGIAMVLF